VPLAPHTLPVVAIVGRPNVGKSTLFNVLTGTRQALVAGEPGLTRDRQYGRAVVGRTACLVVDTGGLTDERHGIDPLIARQVTQALDEADAVLFLVDGRGGLTAADEEITERLRPIGKPIFLVVNKSEGLDRAMVTSDFHQLGLGKPWPISSAHGSGVQALMQEVMEGLPPAPEVQEPGAVQSLRIAVIGRPNVGKSTLVNRMVGEERVLAHDRPGTTRDSIFVPFERDGKAYTLIDTAGVRRRARVSEAIEKFSVIKTLQAIEATNVVVLLIDAQETVTDQDAHLLGHALDAGRALVIAANKWDGLNAERRQRVRLDLERKFAFIDFARIHFISALHGSGVGDLFATIDMAWAAASRKMGTASLTRVLLDAIQAHPPPLVRGRRIKLRYAHQGGQNPPIIVIHGNQTESVPESYRRYLTRCFRKAFALQGTPLRVAFRTGENPYEGRKNVLTARQQKRRWRLMRHAKKGR
jgi:GTP-binding protein